MGRCDPDHLSVERASSVGEGEAWRILAPNSGREWTVAVTYLGSTAMQGQNRHYYSWVATSQGQSPMRSQDVGGAAETIEEALTEAKHWICDAEDRLLVE